MRGRTLILLASAALGFVLGPLLDQIHVQTGTLAYAHPWRVEQAWWVAPQFAVAFVAIAVGSMQILGAPAPVRRPGSAYLAWTIIAFVVAYAVTGLGHQHEWLVVAILGAAFLARVAIERPDRPALLAIGGLVLGGSAYEWTLTSIPETFDYAVASLGTIPVWLPLLYAHAGFAVVALLRRVRNS
jgi:hypothetical protein